jgi:DNA-binding transcriptional LysR family regulator
MEIDLRKLRYFVALAEERHFGRAAERLFIAQPVLSRQIRRLERELGVTLIDRGERQFSLAPAGSQLALDAPRLLAAAEAAFRALHRAARGARTLKIGFAAGLSTAPTLRIFEAREPAVTTELRQIEWQEQASVLLDGRVDVALVRLPISEQGLVLVPLFREPRLAMLPVDHPLAKEERISVLQLADDAVIRHVDASTAWEAFSTVDPRPDGRRPRPGPFVRNVAEKLEQIAAGRAIAFSPASTAASYVHPGVVLVPVTDIPPAEVSIAYRDTANLALISTFVEAALTAVPAAEQARPGAA